MSFKRKMVLADRLGGIVVIRDTVEIEQVWGIKPAIQFEAC